jgi:hypothetical protein
MVRAVLQSLGSTPRSGVRIALFAAAAALFGSITMERQPLSATSYDSQSALRYADGLRAAVEVIDYTDARIRSTDGFTPPDPSLAADGFGGAAMASGYQRTWRITDDVPARSMKTIEIRVKWRGSTARRDQVIVTTVKAS